MRIRLEKLERGRLPRHSKSNTLTWLKLNRNCIGEDGARAIADALKVNSTLRCFLLKQNQIGDAGGQAIAEALKVNTRLTDLLLAMRERALKVNSTMSRLYLEDHLIGDAGAQAITEAFKMNPKLVNVFVYDQINPLALSLLPRLATADDLQTVFCLLTSGPALEDQSTFLPALPAEIADIIMDEAQYWQGVQHIKRCQFDDDSLEHILKVTLPQGVNGNSIRVKAIQALRDMGNGFNSNGSSGFDLIVRDEQGAVRYECAAEATIVDSTLVSARVGWQVQVQPSKSARDVVFESLVVKCM
ncbi:hypothetical protein CAOG_01660 [Capsaspora owczarzaki ATCC 30864]|uniref:hypothetical protein n=1 Tax=Capsaspora owczarzaki (strain ATCC 30864) TaxID=595528 RepID=UPI0001FE25B1|nr:hypothetical protein CAOG_01660 [Capsaspora owczarzaki ATCC 30864]|eukprot:XP_004364528.1 hypothetical protein CAOG_01660 [Capsaspora owczarzaki ATCC 30864]